MQTAENGDERQHCPVMQVEQTHGRLHPFSRSAQMEVWSPSRPGSFLARKGPVALEQGTGWARSPSESPGGKDSLLR